jgi:hypothetical protein
MKYEESRRARTASKAMAEFVRSALRGEQKKFDAALECVHERFGRAMKRLAE